MGPYASHAPTLSTASPALPTTWSAPAVGMGIGLPIAAPVRLALMYIASDAQLMPAPAKYASQPMEPTYQARAMAATIPTVTCAAEITMCVRGV